MVNQSFVDDNGVLVDDHGFHEALLDLVKVTSETFNSIKSKLFRRNEAITLDSQIEEDFERMFVVVACKSGTLVSEEATHHYVAESVSFTQISHLRAVGHLDDVLVLIPRSFIMRLTYTWSVPN